MSAAARISASSARRSSIPARTAICSPLACRRTSRKTTTSCSRAATRSFSRSARTASRPSITDQAARREVRPVAAAAEAHAARPRPERRRGPIEVHAESLLAGARRREHQDQRRSHRQGQLLRRAELPHPEARPRECRQDMRVRHVETHAAAVLDATDDPAVHGAAKLDALVYPTANLPPTKLGAPGGPQANGRAGVWSFLGAQGFPVITAPAGFTTEVYDWVRDPRTRPRSRRPRSSIRTVAAEVAAATSAPRPTVGSGSSGLSPARAARRRRFRRQAVR